MLGHAGICKRGRHGRIIGSPGAERKFCRRYDGLGEDRLGRQARRRLGSFVCVSLKINSKRIDFASKRLNGLIYACGSGREDVILSTQINAIEFARLQKTCFPISPEE
jgi:hypothetical protein